MMYPIRDMFAIAIVGLFVFVCLVLLGEGRRTGNHGLLIRVLIAVAAALGTVLAFYFVAG